MMDLNFLYYAMGGVSLAGIVLATTIAVRADFLPSTGRVARYVRLVQASIPAIIVMGVTTLVVGLQGAFESTVQEALGWDFTPIVFAFEGTLVQWFQDTARTPILDWGFTAVYTVGAFTIYHYPFYFCVLTGRSRSALVIAFALAAIWSVGILAYFFLPVYEVWFTSQAPYNYGHVVNVLFETMPSTAASPYYMDAINNNFPSLHVGASMGVVLALRAAGEKLLFRILMPFSTAIAIATMYLGIHWMVDVVAGVLLAWGASLLAVRAADAFLARGRARATQAGRASSDSVPDSP